MAVEIKQCDLLPCPFCGGNAVRQWHTGPCWIECGQCGAVGPNDGDTTTEQNEAAWNTRIAAEQRQPSSDVAKMREAAEEVAARAFDQYRARNGRMCSIEGDDGEKCWIVPFDAMEDLRRSLSTLPEQRQEAAEEGERFRHIKRGTIYEVIGAAELQMSFDSLVDGSSMVVYRGENGQLWVREEGEFYDAHLKHPSA